MWGGKSQIATTLLCEVNPNIISPDSNFNGALPEETKESFNHSWASYVAP